MSSITSGSHARVLPLARVLTTGLVILVTLFLHFYKLGNYPMPWYDEGSHLHVAKHYALDGVYADGSSEGYRPFGPAVGVGPTVMLPIAAVFSMAGVSIPLARLVIVVYSLLTLLTVHAIASRFVSWPFALLAVVLLLLAPSIRYMYYARTVVGEVPGLFFFLAGLLLWLHPRGRTLAGLVCVGILIGLATITKNQYAFFILPGLLLNWIADLIWYKRRGWRYYVIPGVISGLMFGVWLYIVIIKLGQGGDFTENLNTLRTAGMGALIVIDKDSIPRVAKLLTDESTYGTLFVAAFIYSLLTSWRRDEDSQQRGIIAIFLLVSTALFCVSLGWDRYAFGPVVLAVFFVVQMIRDLAAVVTSDKRGILGVIQQGKPSPSLIVGILLVGWAVVALVLPLYNRYHEISNHANGAAYEVADWMKANVPDDALIETWEQELGVLTDYSIHYPPQIALAHSVAAQWQGGSPVSEYYDFREFVQPDYVIRGPFGAFTNIYPTERLVDYEMVKEIGPYQIFRNRS